MAGRGRGLLLVAPCALVRTAVVRLRTAAGTDGFVERLGRGGTAPCSLLLTAVVPFRTAAGAAGDAVRHNGVGRGVTVPYGTIAIAVSPVGVLGSRLGLPFSCFVVRYIYNQAS